MQGVSVHRTALPPAPPPDLSTHSPPTCSRRVSLESRKGTWVAAGSARALMHMPSVVSERLIDLASVARRPVLPLFFRRSLPARSTRKSLPTCVWVGGGGVYAWE